MKPLKYNGIDTKLLIPVVKSQQLYLIHDYINLSSSIIQQLNIGVKT